MDTLHTLSRRCVECPPVQPECPQCGPNESCSLQPQSCDACASTICVKLGSLPGQAAPKSSMPMGPIVGGVVGGVVAIIIVISLVWCFCIKPRRRKDTWDPPEKRDQSTLARRDTRAHSIASTVLTRASNVIQIAYIPGVTGRSPPESPRVPQMPSMPFSSATNTPGGTPQVEQHFFMPSNLRDSTWSDTSSIDPRISLAPSLARTSVATTDFRADAHVPPIPAQYAFRGQANAVSVKVGALSAGCSSSGSPESRTAPASEAPKSVNVSNSSIVARQVIARPIQVKKSNSGGRVPTLANLARSNSKLSNQPSNLSLVTTNYSDEKEVVIATPSTEIEDSPHSATARSKSSPKPNVNGGSGESVVSSMTGPTTGAEPGKDKSADDLTAMIEAAMNRAARDQTQSPRPAFTREDSGPFSDSNEIKDHGR